MNKSLTRIVSAFVALVGIFAHLFRGETQDAIYFLLMALYLIHVSETL